MEIYFWPLQICRFALTVIWHHANSQRSQIYPSTAQCMSPLVASAMRFGVVYTRRREPIFQAACATNSLYLLHGVCVQKSATPVHHHGPNSFAGVAFVSSESGIRFEFILTFMTSARMFPNRPVESYWPSHSTWIDLCSKRAGRKHTSAVRRFRTKSTLSGWTGAFFEKTTDCSNVRYCTQLVTPGYQKEA